MGLPSRSLKLLLPRLLEEPPLSEGPGPSLPDRSARMRIGPLLNPVTGGNWNREISSLIYMKSQMIWMLVLNDFFLPYISFVIYTTIVLPSVPSIPGWAVVRHAWYWSSGSHGAVMHGHRSSLIPVPTVGVTQFATRRVRGLGSADRFKVLGEALKARVVSVRSRTTLLYVWLTLKPVTSKQRSR